MKKPQSFRNRVVSPKKADLVGVFVLAIGLGILLAVASLFFMKSGLNQNILQEKATKAHNNSPASKVTSLKEQASDKPSASCQGCTKKFLNSTDAPAPEQNVLYYPLKKEIMGRWTTQFSGGMVELVLADLTFQIVHVSDIEGRYRKYSRGYYTYSETTGILKLQPSEKVGAPDPIPGVQYNVLTMRTFDISVRKKHSEPYIFWFPTAEQIPSQRMHPLFLYMGIKDVPVLRWSNAQKR